ncbi:MAG: transporter substrate-binding domain-containing protein [Clostridiales bacterium]|jgi:polar amino acid transport system substrate-binding protein|nr:transporter substrate-binding domain-containing protein [Clostridiales bacterium]
MKKLKFAVLTLTLVTGLCLFAGCAAQESTEATPSAPAVTEGAVTDTTEETDNTDATAPETSGGQLIVGTNAAFPPFEYIMENGIVDNFSGVDIAISKEIADALGKELVVQDMEFTAVLAAVSSGNVDFGAAGLTADDERRQSMDFSIPYYTAMQSIIVKKDNATITSAEDIKPLVVGVVQGFTGQSVCEDELMIPESNLKVYDIGMAAVADLKRDAVDAVVIDSHTAAAMVSLNSDLKIVEDPETFSTEEYAIAVQKGNTEMLDAVNGVLKEMIESGKIDALVAEHGAATME